MTNSCDACTAVRPMQQSTQQHITQQNTPQCSAHCAQIYRIPLGNMLHTKARPKSVCAAKAARGAVEGEGNTLQLWLR